MFPTNCKPPPKGEGASSQGKLKNAAVSNRIDTRLGSHVAPAPANRRIEQTTPVRADQAERAAL